MTTKLFSEFDLSGSALEQLELRQQCINLYEDIVTGLVDEDLFNDFCECLQNQDFFEAVKPLFPVLRKDTDEHFDHETTAEYVTRMQDAASRHTRELYLPPAAHNEANLQVRHFLSTMVYFVHLKDDLDPAVKTALFRAFSRLFEIAGASQPGYIDGYLNGEEGTSGFKRQKKPLTQSRGAQSARQPDNITTQTGVYNGGNTCYQNIVWRLFLSSDEVVRLMSRDGVADLFLNPNDDDKLGGSVFELLRAIISGDHEASKDLLRKVWRAIEDRLGEGWARGIQQDAEELVHHFAGAFSTHFLLPAWQYQLGYEDTCCRCNKCETKDPAPNLVYKLPLCKQASIFSQATDDDDNRSPQELVDMLNDTLTIPETITKTCADCGVNTLHSRQSSMRNEPGSAPELVIQLLRFNAERQKLRHQFSLPSRFFLVRGSDTLYYLRYVAVHIGGDIQHGHYVSFERPSPGQAKDAYQQVFDADSSSETLVTPLERFHFWTKYDDSRKDLNQTLEAIEREYGQDTYILRIAPVSMDDLGALNLHRDAVNDITSNMLEECGDYTGPPAEAVNELGRETTHAILRHIKAMIAQFIQPMFNEGADQSLTDSELLQVLSTALSRDIVRQGLSRMWLTLFLENWLTDCWDRAVSHEDTPSSLDDHIINVLVVMFNRKHNARIILCAARAHAERQTGPREAAVKRTLDVEYEFLEEQQLAVEARLQERRNEEDARLVAEKAKAHEADKWFRERQRLLEDQLAEIKKQQSRDTEEARALALAVKESMEHQSGGSGTNDNDSPPPSEHPKDPAAFRQELQKLTRSLNTDIPRLLKLISLSTAMGEQPPSSLGPLNQTIGELARLSQESGKQMPPPKRPDQSNTNRSRGDSNASSTHSRGRPAAGSRQHSRAGTHGATDNGSPKSRGGSTSRGSGSAGRASTTSKTAAGKTAAPAKSSTTSGQPPFLKMNQSTYTYSAPGAQTTPTTAGQSSIARHAGAANQFLAGGSAGSRRDGQRQTPPPPFNIAQRAPGTPTSNLPSRPSPRRPRAESDSQPRASHPSDPLGRQSPYAERGSPRIDPETQRGSQPSVTGSRGHGSERRRGRLHRGLNPRNRDGDGDPFTDNTGGAGGAQLDGPADNSGLSSHQPSQEAPSDTPSVPSLQLPSENFARPKSGGTTWAKKSASTLRSMNPFSSQRRQRSTSRSGPALARAKSTLGIAAMFGRQDQDASRPISRADTRAQDVSAADPDENSRPDGELRRRSSVFDLLRIGGPKGPSKAAATTAQPDATDIERSNLDVSTPRPAGLGIRRVPHMDRPESSATVIRTALNQPERAQGDDVDMQDVGEHDSPQPEDDQSRTAEPKQQP